MKLPASASESSGPNLTPVIDVVFLLLIFFLVATRFDQEEKEIGVDVPDVVLAQPITSTKGLVINITREGKYKVVRKEYSEAQLESLVKLAKRNNPHQSALIRGDGNSDLKFAARVMSLCKRAGMKCTLATNEIRKK